MRRLILIASLALTLWAVRTNNTVTVTAGTPVQLVATQTMVQEFIVQMAKGGAGSGIVMDMNGFPAGTVPSSTNGAHVSGHLAPATATAPGQAYSDQCVNRCIDMSRVWVDGSNSGDTIITSWR